MPDEAQNASTFDEYAKEQFEKVVEKALNTAIYSVDTLSDETRPSRSVVLNLDAVGAPGASQWLLKQVIPNLFREKKYVSDRFFARVKAQQKAAQIAFAERAENKYMAFSMNSNSAVLRPRTSMAVYYPALYNRQSVDTRFALWHPTWYVGFFRDTRLELTGNAQTGNPASGRIEFRNGSNTVKIPLRFSGDQHLSDIIIAEWFDAEDGPIIDGRRIDNQFGGLEGWLLQWSKPWQRNQAYLYPNWHANTDVLDNVRIVMENGELLFHKMTIIYNGEPVLTFDGAIRAEPGYPADLTEPISTYRQSSLLYKRGRIHLRTPHYNPADIRDNAILRTAASQIGKAYSPKYNRVEWRKRDDGTFYDEPKNWCSKFKRWTILQNYEIEGLENTGGDTQTLSNWFRNEKGKLICFDPDLRWEYANLDKTVRTGAYVALRDCSHSAFFINWLKPVMNDDTTRPITDWSDLQEIDRKHRPSVDAEPGIFDPGVNVNWFRAIGGNQSKTVNIAVYGVFYLEPSAQSLRVIYECNGRAADKNPEEYPSRTTITCVYWCKYARLSGFRWYDGFVNLPLFDVSPKIIPEGRRFVRKYV
ncbi:hypothetical protein K8I61_13865 [bacterium]|nr:hypothetical protein [bacterium]